MALAGDHVQVLVGGYDLTGDHNRVVINNQRQMLEATAFGMSSQRFIPGQQRADLQHGGYLNPETGGSHPALSGVSVDGAVSVLVGQNADPVAGDPAFVLQTQQTRYQTSPSVGAENGSIINFNADFANRGTGAGWGTIFVPPSTITGEFNIGTTVDNGAASNKGGLATLHILQASGTYQFEIKIQRSVNGTDWTTLAADDFTLNGLATGSEVMELRGPTVPRYLRYHIQQLSGTTDSITLAIAVVRF